MVLVRLWESLLALVYPKICLHCNSIDVTSESVLCNVCSVNMEFIQSSVRCKLCFETLDNQTNSYCHRCYHKKNSFYALAAAMDYEGPAASLVKHFKHGGKYYLADGMGAMMAVQWNQLGWPQPDCLVPVPMSASHLIKRGYNQSLLLAKSLGKFINSPVVEALGRYSGDYSQAGLTRQQRLSLNNESLVLKDKFAIKEKIVFIIDDVMTTGSTLARCAEVLAQGSPRAIYGLTFARAT